MSNGVNFRKLAVDLRQELTACQKERDAGLAREAELKRQLKETPIPQEIAAEMERTDWTPKQALKWYAEGKHFDVVAGRTRIIDTGHVASNALKHLSAEYLEHKGDAQLHELKQHLAEAEKKLDPVDGDLLPAVGSKVFIHLARSDSWAEHTVVGYYAWDNHGLDRNVHRIFVRVRDSQGYLNARLLNDIRLASPGCADGEKA